MTDSYIEYIKLHIISLEQDLENITEEMEKLDPASKDYNELDFEYNHTAGQLIAARHLLTVYGDLLYNGNLRREYNG
jgi:hypothetical protein